MNSATSDAPVGLIAMLFTDIEGSTSLAASLGSGWPGVLSAHHDIVKDAVRAHGGWLDGAAGDGFFVTFTDVRAAALAAVTVQRALRARSWPAAVGELRVRMGLHVGQVDRDRHGYVGLEVHRAARVGAAAHGGELLLTGVAAELAGDAVATQPLGAHRLKDFPAPVALHCAVIDGRGASDFPPPRTLELRAGNLPAAPRPLVGRESDIGRLRTALLADGERIVSALGRGGVGKTTVALVVAGELLDAFPGGAWWVDASRERDVAGLRSAIARSCRLSTPGSLEEALPAEFGPRGRTLLVLDNLEQIAGAGELVASLAGASAEIRILATSQLPLGCPGERRMPLDCLDPEDGLELLRRSAERLGVTLGDDAAGAELVELLDGLPLAIELAAGRLRMFGAAELMKRLRASTAILSDRSGQRPDRQRSLPAALEWTVELLDPDARALFVRLGVFAGPVELSEIELVTAGDDELDVLSAVETLLDGALLRRVETGDGRVRLGLPEAVRQEAVRRLDAGEGDRWRRAHARRARVLVWPARLYDVAELAVIEAARQASAETLAALEWAWDHDRDLAREIALGRLGLASHADSMREMSALVDRLMADPGEDPQIVDFVRCVAVTRDAYAGATDLEGRLRSLLPEIEDPDARLSCHVNLAVAATQEGRIDDGLADMDAALPLARGRGPLAEASLLAVRAEMLVELGRHEAAAAAIVQAERMAGTQRSPCLERMELIRAELALARGDIDAALDGYARALTSAELAADHIQLHWIMIRFLSGLAKARRERAMLELFGITLAQADERSEQGLGGLLAWHPEEPAIAEARARLGSEAASLIDAGRSLPAAARVKRACVLAFASA